MLRVIPMLLSSKITGTFLLLCLLACKSNPPPSQDASAFFTEAELQFRVPRLQNWVRDPSVALSDPAKGGTAMRLQKSNTVAGAPKFSISVEPLRTKPSSLDAYVTQNLAPWVS